MPDSRSRRYEISALAFVGDLHGRIDALEAVLAEYGGSRRLVFLGDYVNRGPDSRAVLTRLISAKRLLGDVIVLLRGNHDESVLEFLNGGALATFVRLGGLATVASYTNEIGNDIREALSAAIPRQHVELLEHLRDFFEEEDVFASHCGINPQRPASRDRQDVALTSHPELFEADLSCFGKTIVCGHYVQRDLRPYVTDKLVAIDTGCGSIASAPLTVLLWPERSTVALGGE